MGKNTVTKVKHTICSPKKKNASNALKIIQKSSPSLAVINANSLPLINVSLTRLMPKKMPVIAMKQYYKLTKSSGFSSVISKDRTAWGTLSPEATPERDIPRTSRNSNVFSPTTRTQLQFSPLDLDTNCDFDSEPWSDNSEPYPSPKSPGNDQRFDGRGWSKSPTLVNSLSSRDKEFDKLLCRNSSSSCDMEVETIMARQDSAVPYATAAIPLQRPHPRKILLQNVTIPLQPFDFGGEKSQDKVQGGEQSPLATNQHSPIWVRKGVWFSPGEKLLGKDKPVINGGKKRGRPKKIKRQDASKGEVVSPNKTISVNSVKLSDKDKPVKKEGSIKRGMPKKVKQQDSSKGEVVLPNKTISVNLVKLSDKEKPLKKEGGKKRGMLKKIKRQDSSKGEVVLPYKTISVNSVTSSQGIRNLTPVCLKEAEQENGKESKREEGRTSKRKQVEHNVEAEASSSTKEKTVGRSRSSLQGIIQSLSATAKHLPLKDKGDRFVMRTVQVPKMPREPSQIVINLDSPSSMKESSLDSPYDVTTMQVTIQDKQDREGLVTTPKINKWLSGVRIEVSPLIKSLELSKKQQGVISPLKSNVFSFDLKETECLSRNLESSNTETSKILDESVHNDTIKCVRQTGNQEEKECITRNLESSNAKTSKIFDESIHPDRIKSVRQELFPTLDQEETECIARNLESSNAETSNTFEEFVQHDSIKSVRQERFPNGVQEEADCLSRRYEFSQTCNTLNKSTNCDRTKLVRQELFPSEEKQDKTNPHTSKYECRKRKRSEESPDNTSKRLRSLENRLPSSLSQGRLVQAEADRTEDTLERSPKPVSPLMTLSVQCERLPIYIGSDNNTICSDSLARNSAIVDETVNIDGVKQALDQPQEPSRSSSFGLACQTQGSLDGYSLSMDEASPISSSKRSSPSRTGFQTNGSIDISPLLRTQESPLLFSKGKDTILVHDNQPYELLEGKVSIAPCSPVQVSKPSMFFNQREKSKDEPSSRNGDILLCHKDNHEVPNQSSYHQDNDYNVSPMTIAKNGSPKLSSKISDTCLLDGKVCLAPCSPLQTSKTPVFWNQRDRRESTKSEVSSVTSPRDGELSAAKGSKSPVPLQDLVIKCERLVPKEYNVFTSPETISVKPRKPRTVRKTAEKTKDPKAILENKKTNKRGRKRKKKNNSDTNKKPGKKRKLTVPDHYWNYKPSQLRTISHSGMRYRVAFTFWPQKYSGALDRINQRLVNQNAFWNSLK